MEDREQGEQEKERERDEEEPSFFFRCFQGAHFFLFFILFDLEKKKTSKKYPSFLSPKKQKKTKQDAKGACSFNENFANTMSSSSWTAGTMVTIAMNHDQFNGGKGCGTCIMYRGIGGGVGVTPLSTTQWTMGIVNNQCPECNKGSIDQNINGDGRWNVEWFAVPCNVGDGKIKYSRISNLGPEYWALVVSNTRVPVKDVQIKVDGKERREFFFGLFSSLFLLFLWRERARERERESERASESARTCARERERKKREMSFLNFEQKRSLFLSLLPFPPPPPPNEKQRQARGTPLTTPRTTSGSGPASPSTATGPSPTSRCRSA